MTIFHIETPKQQSKNGHTIRYSVLADTDKIIKVRKTEYDSSGNVRDIKEMPLEQVFKTAFPEDY